MKIKLLTLLLSIGVCVAQTGKLAKLHAEPTKRVVNGQVIDLKPLFDWETHRAKLAGTSVTVGPRPLPGWDVRSFESLEKTPTGDLVKMYEAGTGTICLIKNLPKNVSTGYLLKTAQVERVTYAGQALVVPVYDYGRPVPGS